MILSASFRPSELSKNLQIIAKLLRDADISIHPGQREEETDETRSPCVVSAVRLDEVHVAVLGQEGHQLLVGPEGRQKL